MSERTPETKSRQQSPGEANEGRANAARSFLGTILCVLGILLALFGFVVPFISGSAATSSISLQFIGVLLGLTGFFLGAGRLAVAAITLCVISALFGLAAGEGYVPGVEETDRDLPAQEPDAQRPGDNG